MLEYEIATKAFKAIVKRNKLEQFFLDGYKALMISKLSQAYSSVEVGKAKTWTGLSVDDL